jgi:hypothetical protein
MGAREGCKRGAPFRPSRPSRDTKPSKINLDNLLGSAHRHNMRYAFAALVCFIACIVHATPFLTVSSPTTNVILHAGDFAALPQMKIQLMDPHEKKMHQFSGVAVSEVLTCVGAPSGEKLRGGALRQIIIFRARDAYAVSFALADFDANYSDRTIFLADEEDGAPLSATAGPLRLIVPGDKKAARWERMVTNIEIVDPDQLKR